MSGERDSAPLDLNLLPDTAEVDGDDHLLIGGLRVVDLAAEFGTPLFVYDEEHLRARCREARAGFGEHAAYASKAFLCGAMAKLVNEEGLRIDVASAGELFVALRSGVPAAQCVFHGNNKSTEELAFALQNHIGLIVIDSFEEMDRIEWLVTEGLAPPRVMVRVTPGIEVHTFEEVQTGQLDSKFGFGWSSGAAAMAARRAAASPQMHLIGLHMHIGSQVFSVANFAQAVRLVAPLVRELDLEEFCVGGGLGVAYVAGEESTTISQWAKAILDAVREEGITAVIGAEPGRSIAAQAGVTLYTIGTVKEIPGVRTYVAVDGGMSDNPRPVLYGSGYEAFLPRAVTAPRPDIVRVVGKHCESGDVLVREAQVPAGLEVGDILCTPVTGAYGYSMGSNYNRVPRPAVVFVRDGQARCVARRETLEDLVALEVPDSD